MFERLVASVRGLLQRRRAHRELDEELAFHVEMETRANLKKGLPPAEARRKTLVDLGGIDQTKEAVRDQRATVFDRLAQDLRYALRRMRREPGNALVAIVTIGLAVGLTTAIYSVADAVLLRPLPYQDPDRLVAVWQGAQGFDDVPMIMPQILELRARDADFVNLAALERDSYTLMAPGISEWCETFLVTPNLFDMLGVHPIVGRTFTAADGQPGGENVIVLSEGYWRRVFGGDPGVVGRRVRLGGQRPDSSAGETYEVVGVVPSNVQLFYRFPTLRPDVCAPVVVGDADRVVKPGQNFRLWFTFGRLGPGVTIDRASANVRALMAAFAQQLPDFQEFRARVVSLHDELLGQARPTLLLLGAGVILVLLIACVNVATLLLAGGTRRTRELTIRLAIGCSRRRLLGQLLTEPLLLAALGGLLGIVLAAWATPVIAGLAPSSLPRVDQVRMDLSVLGFALAVSLLSGLAFGAAPAWALTGTRLLVTRVGPLAVTPGTRRVRSAFVVAETALLVVLLAAAGLVANSLWRLAHLALGFDPEHVVVIDVGLPQRWTDADHAVLLDRRWLDTARELSGVTGAALGDDVPFSWGALNKVQLEGADASVPSSITAVDRDYLSLLKVPLREGRMFTPRDAGNQQVAIVNEALARRLIPSGRALGRRIQVGDTWREIVGVVGNIHEVGQIRATYIKQDGLSRLTLPAAYVPLGTWYGPYNAYLLARTSLDTPAVIRGVGKALRALDPELAIRKSGTLEARVEGAGAGMRFEALLMSLFAAVALVLAAVGLYGVLAHMVGQRTREIGIRMALGARPSQVRRMVSGQAATLAGAGAAIGLGAALAEGRILRSLLFEVSPTDPATLAAAVLVLLLVAALAAWLPARRATRVDPATTLRSE